MLGEGPRRVVVAKAAEGNITSGQSEPQQPSPGPSCWAAGESGSAPAQEGQWVERRLTSPAEN